MVFSSARDLLTCLKISQVKLNPAIVRKFAKVSAHNFFLRKSQTKKECLYIEPLGKKANWESWSKKFPLHGKNKEYKKLLVSSGSMSGVHKIPWQKECENALKGDMDLDKKCKIR